MELLGLIQNDSPVRSNWANHSGIRFSRACTPQPWVSAVLWAGSLPWPLVGRWGGGLFLEVPPPASSRDEAIGSFFFFFQSGLFYFLETGQQQAGDNGHFLDQLGCYSFQRNGMPAVKCQVPGPLAQAGVQQAGKLPKAQGHSRCHLWALIPQRECPRRRRVSSGGLGVLEKRSARGGSEDRET